VWVRSAVGLIVDRLAALLKVEADLFARAGEQGLVFGGLFDQDCAGTMSGSLPVPAMPGR
jgi:hypothetical protein